MHSNSRRVLAAAILTTTIALPVLATPSVDPAPSFLGALVERLLGFLDEPSVTPVTSPNTAYPAMDPNGSEQPVIILDDPEASQQSTGTEGEAYPSMDPNG